MFSADTYDALICVGAFGAGHLQDNCFPELIRITKPGKPNDATNSTILGGNDGNKLTCIAPCLYLATSCHVAHEASTHFRQLSLSFAAAPTLFHDLHPARVLSVLTVLHHVVCGLPLFLSLQVSMLVPRCGRSLVPFSLFVWWTSTLFV